MSATRKRLGRPKANWENGFAALMKFKAREGHCRVPRGHIEASYKLGLWVSVQRERRDFIATELRKRLDAIGFVWGPREDAWETGFSALLKFKAREGHCRVPLLHIEGKCKLGQWASRQRVRQDLISTNLKKRLDAIGFVWRSREDAWESAFSALMKFKAREGALSRTSLACLRNLQAWTVGIGTTLSPRLYFH